MLKVWNYGGGVQTLAILCLIRQGRLPVPDVAIFADTGDEPTEVMEWLEFVRPLMPCELRVVKRDGLGILDDCTERIKKGRRLDNPPFWVRGIDGKSSPISRGCTREWKINVIRKEIKNILGISPRCRWPVECKVEQWLGISSDEKQRAKNSIEKWGRFWHPLIEQEWPIDDFWRPKRLAQGVSRGGCFEIIQDSIVKENWKPPTPSPPKSACIHCPFRSNKMWRRLRDSDSQGWLDACNFDSNLRLNGKIHGMKKDVFLHRSLVPLVEVNLDENIGSTMDHECAGICGV